MSRKSGISEKKSFVTLDIQNVFIVKLTPRISKRKNKELSEKVRHISSTIFFIFI